MRGQKTAREQSEYSMTVLATGSAYLFKSLSLLVVRSSNLVHTVSLITNNCKYSRYRPK